MSARCLLTLALAAGLVLTACSDDEEGDATAPTPLPGATTTTGAGSTTAGGSPSTSTSTSTTSTRPGSSVATTTPAPGAASVDDVRITLTPVVQLEQPLALALRPGDDSLYVAERTGHIRVVRDGVVQPAPVLDLSSLTVAGGERGLLGLAIAPDGAYLYADYTDVRGDSHLDEFAMAPDGSVDPASRRQVLFQDQPYANHNGGGIVFGPDGYLYVGFGDGGSAGDPERRALRLDTWLGKLLRIDPRPQGDQPYGVPADNPFVGQAGALPEIWSYGLRNPWRFSFDRETDDLWIADVGQSSQEEIDLAPASSGAGRGLNFGWSAFEGTRRFNRDQPADGTVGPVAVYEHGSDLGGCSITGGVVYRGPDVPALVGAYLFADYCVAGVRALPSGVATPPTRELTTTPGGIASFGEGPQGEVYVLTLAGPIYRITAG